MLQSKFYIVSLDPAQLNDYSALAVIEASAQHYRLMSLRRKQRLPYDKIVTWTLKTLQDPKIQANTKEGTYNPALVLDIGGVGLAIKDMFAAQGIKNIQGIQLTAGDTESREGTTFYVSKSHVIGKLLARWDEGKVTMPSTASFFALFNNELRAFRGAMSAQGRARFEAEQGEHDDLVMAVAQAIWWAESRPKTPPALSIPPFDPSELRPPPYRLSGEPPPSKPGDYGCGIPHAPPR